MWELVLGDVDMNDRQDPISLMTSPVYTLLCSRVPYP